jgi:hypothetical protein
VALVERRGAKITTAERSLRFVPTSSSGNPLIVVDLLDVHWGIGSFSPPLNAVPPDELLSLATELAALGVPACAQHYHGITGTIALDSPRAPQPAGGGAPLRPGLPSARHSTVRSAGTARRKVVQLACRRPPPSCLAPHRSRGRRRTMISAPLTESLLLVLGGTDSQ